MMKQAGGLIFRMALFGLIVALWWWIYHQQFSKLASFLLVVGCILLTFPVVWAGFGVLVVIGHLVSIRVVCCMGAAAGHPRLAGVCGIL
jgi:hypothetical protein